MERLKNRTVDQQGKIFLQRQFSVSSASACFSLGPWKSHGTTNNQLFLNFTLLKAGEMKSSVLIAKALE